MLTHLCAYLSCTRILGHLLQSQGGSVWHIDSGGRTPLHYATGFLFPPIQFFEVSPECARLLLQAGADASAADDNALTPLHYIATKPTIAAPECDTEVMLAWMLLEHGADPNAQNLQGVRPVHLVTMNDYINRRLLAFLVQRGADVNARDLHGDTLLHLLFHKRWVSDEDTKFLLTCGADPNLANHTGLTPLQVLLTRPRVKSHYERHLIRRVVGILLEGGAHVQHVFAEPEVAGMIRRKWGNDRKMMLKLSSLDEGGVKKKAHFDGPCRLGEVVSSWHVAYSSPDPLLRRDSSEDQFLGDLRTSSLR